MKPEIPRWSSKQSIVLGVSVGYVAISTILEVLLVRLETFTSGAKILFFLFLNMNILALFWLLLIVIRHMWRLMSDRKQGIIGTKFKTRVVINFFFLTAIPLFLLFFIAVEVGNNYIDRFFTPTFRQPLKSSVEIAKAMYEMERTRAIAFAKLAKNGYAIPEQYKFKVIESKADDSSTAAREAFLGREGSEVITLEETDMVRAAIPFIVNGTNVRSIIQVETALPKTIVRDIKTITSAYKEYLLLEQAELPLKLNYILILAFFTLTIIMTSILISIRISDSMTEPVKSLALATEKVAAGNLDVHVKAKSQDEIGMLIKSFNHMVLELKAGKDSLEHAYMDLDNIVSNIRSGVISINPDGMVQSINQSACKLFEVTEAEIINKHHMQLIDKAESSELAEMAQNINLREFLQIEREIWATLQKQKVLLRVSITGLISHIDAGLLGYLVVVDDITDFIKAQRAMAWQEVARRMAHEIKNPLTPILLNTERLLKKWQKKDPEFDAIFERSARTIINEVQSLKGMVNEFSKFGKMPEIRKVPTNIIDIIQSVSDLYLDLKDIQINTELPPTIPLVLLDGAQFKRVLINLFDNALEAMDKKGVITVSALPDIEANRISVSVADLGPGIREEDKEKLFQPYFSTRKDGTGLGLAIADRIVAEHGGSFRIRDNTPCGSIFTIEIPIDGV